MKKHSLIGRHEGFTLVEMLTVVGIIALLIALATPTLVDVIRSTRLSSAGDSLQNRLNLAQQEAISRSQEVEVRFYKYQNSSSEVPDQSLFYAYQVVETPGGKDAVAISEPYFLETGIVISPKQELSPLLQTTVPQKQGAVSQRYLFNPGSGSTEAAVEYAALRYYPDGSCRLLTSATVEENDQQSTAIGYTIPPLTNSFLTLLETQFVDSPELPPLNFYCLQIDSYTGKVRIYRP